MQSDLVELTVSEAAVVEASVRKTLSWLLPICVETRKRVGVPAGWSESTLMVECVSEAIDALMVSAALGIISPSYGLCRKTHHYVKDLLREVTLD